MLPGLVQGHVGREDQGTGGRDLEAPARGDALGLQHSELLEQGCGREHHAVADEALHVVAQDARGDELEHSLLAADDERVAGVVSALKAHHGRRAVREPVHDLAFALVAPLGTDDDYVLAHHPLRTK